MGDTERATAPSEIDYGSGVSTIENTARVTMAQTKLINTPENNPLANNLQMRNYNN